MKLYWVKTHRIIKQLLSGYVWDIPNKEKTLYLTFDDGPTPEITEWVLDLLAQHDIKATFFCIGNNIDKHPDVFKKVIAQGHAIGNHTYNHLNGWKTDYDTYLQNTDACEKTIENYNPQVKTTAFRPPYGKIKSAQAKAVKAKGYKIIMWDVLSADFDTSITPQECLENVIENTCEGSVIIFHDSVKAYTNLEYALPKAIDYLKEKGFKFGKIA